MMWFCEAIIKVCFCKKSSFWGCWWENGRDGFETRLYACYQLRFAEKCFQDTSWTERTPYRRLKI